MDESQTLTLKQKKDYAKHLYLTEPGAMQKDIADRVGVSRNTMSRWVTDGKWEELRTNTITSKSTQLARLYNHLKELNDDIESRPQGERYNNKDADIVIKLTAAIRNLETETNIGDKIEVGKQFLTFARRAASSPETVKEIATLFDAYIKSCL